jgi:hypothetical protein
VRLVQAVSGVLQHLDRDEVAPQQARATRALSRLLGGSGLTVHVERGGRRIATLGGDVRTRDLAGPVLEPASGRLLRPRRRDLTPLRPREVRAEDGATEVPDRTPVVIGSHPTCDLVLAGLKPRHAVLGRDVSGRTVLKALAGRCYVDGSPVVSQVVDDDSEILLGEHRLTLGQGAQVWCT